MALNELDSAEATLNAALSAAKRLDPKIDEASFGTSFIWLRLSQGRAKDALEISQRGHQS